MTVAPVYYLWGEEKYLIDEKIQEIIARLREESSEEPELVLIDADETGWAELAESLEFSGLFAMSRVVIIKDPFWLDKSTRKVKKADEILRVLQEYVTHPVRDQILIITSSEHAAGNPIVKLLDKNSQVLNIKSLSADGLQSWLSKESAARGMALDAPALTALAGSGQDMYYLQNLLDKLSLINFPGSIGIKELEEHLDSRHSIKVFKLTDALLNRNLNESLQAFYQLQEQGEHPLFMLYMISRQLLSLAKVKAYKGMGQSVQEIAGRLGQKDFAVKNMLKKSSNFSQEDIRRLFQRLLETDKSFKSEGKPADILMETLIIEFCRPNN